MPFHNPSSDFEIRDRLLRSLGIQKGERASPDKQQTAELPGTNRQWSTFQQPLKTTYPDDTVKNDKSSRIQFNTHVTVIQIPSHSQYSNRIKQRLWSNREEISQNAKRNLREFASEGWDVNKVVEEDKMFLDACSKEFIHPVHFRGIMDVHV